MLLYLTCIRPVTEYTRPVCHHSLLQYLSFDLEECQRQALRIIYPDCSYDMALSTTGIIPLHEHWELLSDKLSNSIFCNPSHKLSVLLPSKNGCKVNLRNKLAFTTRCTHSTHTRNSFIHHCVNKAMTQTSPSHSFFF